MRQPKFKFGETIKYAATFKHTYNETLTIKSMVNGIVSSIYYDPNNMSTGRPFYYYDIVVSGKLINNIKEEELIGVEND